MYDAGCCWAIDIIAFIFAILCDSLGILGSDTGITSILLRLKSSLKTCCAPPATSYGYISGRYSWSNLAKIRKSLDWAECKRLCTALNILDDCSNNAIVVPTGP